MLTRIYKPAARKLFNAGKPFWITACNMRPECGLLIDPTRYIDTFPTFDKLVNAFFFYSCDSERGRYPAYYVEG